MILYFDTSALVKLYVDEPGRAAVVAQVDRAARREKLPAPALSAAPD